MLMQENLIAFMRMCQRHVRKRMHPVSILVVLSFFLFTFSRFSKFAQHSWKDPFFLKPCADTEEPYILRKNIVHRDGTRKERGGHKF